MTTLATEGIVEVTGESGLVDGGAITSKLVTFNPQASSGMISIRVFDEADNREIARHIVPVKSLALNTNNTILEIGQVPAHDTPAAPVIDERLQLFLHGINPRVEISLMGKVVGQLGGAIANAYGDGVFTWKPTFAAQSELVLVESKMFEAQTKRGQEGNLGQSHLKGWLENWAVIQLLIANAPFMNADKALCAHFCGNPLADDTCSTWAAGTSEGCRAVCNCALTTGSNSWGACTTGTPSCAW